MNASVQQGLQRKLAITPKTARLLLELGYQDFTELRHATPNDLVRKLADLPQMTPRTAEPYRRGLRRMVWLATQSDPEAMAKLHQDWTQRALKARGAWCDNWDDLTGLEAEECLRRAG